MFFSLVAEWKKRLSIASVTVTPVSNLAVFRQQFVKMEAAVVPLTYLWPWVLAIHCNLLGLPHLCTNAKFSHIYYFCNALVLIKLFWWRQLLWEEETDRFIGQFLGNRLNHGQCRLTPLVYQAKSDHIGPNQTRLDNFCQSVAAAGDCTLIGAQESGCHSQRTKEFPFKHRAV